MNYPTFDDIEHTPLKVYNRSVMFYNLLEDSGEEAAKEYIAGFSKTERLQMIALVQLVKKRGVKAVKELVTKDLVFPENMTDQEVLESLP